MRSFFLFFTLLNKIKLRGSASPWPQLRLLLVTRVIKLATDFNVSRLSVRVEAAHLTRFLFWHKAVKV